MKKKSLSNISRSLHRDLGYFFIGITLIYAITGFILSARGLGWFKKEYNFQTTISKNIPIESFKDKLLLEVKEGAFGEVYNKVTKKNIHSKIKRLAFTEKKEDRLYFFSKSLNLNYNPSTGNVDVYYKSYPTFLYMFISAHLSKDDRAWFYLAMTYSVVLAFFAISAIFMVKGKYGFKRRGIYFSLLGVFTIVVFLYLSF